MTLSVTSDLVILPHDHDETKHIHKNANFFSIYPQSYKSWTAAQHPAPDINDSPRFALPRKYPMKCFNKVYYLFVLSCGEPYSGPALSSRSPHFCCWKDGVVPMRTRQGVFPPYHHVNTSLQTKGTTAQKGPYRQNVTTVITNGPTATKTTLSGTAGKQWILIHWVSGRNTKSNRSSVPLNSTKQFT